MTNDQLLVTLDGPGIGESGVPLETFTAVLGRIQSAMRLMVGHLGGRQPSPGQPPSWMRDQSRMRLTATRSGSFVAQLTLEPSRDGQSDMFGYGPRALGAILGWDGMEDSTLPPMVVDELQHAASSLPPDVQLWLGDSDDSRKVEVGRTVRVDKLTPRPDAALLEGWLKEVNWDRRTAQLHQFGGEYVRLRFDAELDDEMLRLATRYIEVRGRGRFNRNDEWTTVDVERVREVRSWQQPFDVEAFRNNPSPKLFDPEKIVAIDMTDDEWESFDRAIREGRDAPDG